MKTLVFAFLLFQCALQMHAQSPQWKSLSSVMETYQIDGSLSSIEMHDTTALKSVEDHTRYVIKKSDDFTYIAIRSNSGTILNAYAISDEKVKIMHASAALGEIDLNKEGGRYKAEKTEFDWIYRDPNVWDEKHPEGVDSPMEFYQKFGWMANTWTSGSYREMEMIIDNSLLPTGTRMMISYTSSEDGVRAIRFMEGSEESSLTGNAESDQQIHNGYIPAFIELANQ